MKTFAPILLGDLALRKQLFDYLYTLEDDDNSINAQQRGLPSSENIGSLPASEQSTSIDFASFACEPEDFTHGSIFTEPLYYFLNLSSDADYKKYSAKLKVIMLHSQVNILFLQSCLIIQKLIFVIKFRKSFCILGYLLFLLLIAFQFYKITLIG